MQQTRGAKRKIAMLFEMQDGQSIVLYSILVCVHYDPSLIRSEVFLLQRSLPAFFLEGSQNHMQQCLSERAGSTIADGHR